MRIHFYGNVLNWAYQFAKFFHAAGHEVRVFLDRRERVQVYRPEWEDGELRDGLPEWVEAVDVGLDRLLTPGRTERAFIERLGACDLIQAFGEYALWAWRTRTPYVVLSYGGDLEIIAFSRAGLKGLLLARLLRRAFRRAAAFVYAIPSHQALAGRLRLRNAVFNPHAVPVDTDRYAPLDPTERRALRSVFAEKLVLFHGARQEWTWKDANDKANDRLFRAFARFVHGGGRDALLIAAERGRDVERSKALVASLGVADRVRWVPELQKPELIRMLNSVDAFCDQFSHGYYGVAALEALSCAVPTFTYIDTAAAVGVDLPPVINVGSEEEILRGIAEFAGLGTRAALGRRAREWVLAHHGWKAVGEWYEALYEQASRKPAGRTHGET